MNAWDAAVLAAYAALVLWIGARAARGDAGPDAWTLGGRALPGWAVLCSTVATELSAATFIGVPHAAYTGDWFYLQFAIGALLGKTLLAATVIPLYHRLRVVTVYGFLEHRFGPHSRRAAALCFVAGRILASGVRLFIAALAFAAVTDWSIEAAILACGLAAGLYTRVGGLRAVVWTDVLQAFLLVGGAVAVLAVLDARLEGGLTALPAWAAEGDRMQVLHLEPLFGWADGRALGVAVVGGFFLTLATHATDHDMVQRLLATRSDRSASRALVTSALLNFPMTALFLLIGTALAAFYATAPSYDIDDAARILPLFAVHELPAGVRGLLFAGLFAAAMSSLDSAICALATTWVADVRGGTAAARDPVHMRRVSAVFTLLLMGAAIAMAAYHRAASDAEPALTLVDVALSAMTVLYGGLLGVFAVGVAWRGRGDDRSARFGLAVGATLGAALFLHPVLLGETWLAWPWWIPLSASVTALVVASARARGSADPRLL